MGRARKISCHAITIAPLRVRRKIRGMLMLTCKGPRSIVDRDVLFVYREATRASYCNVMASGEEISGRAVTAAIDKIEREIAGNLLPLEAA